MFHWFPTDSKRKGEDGFGNQATKKRMVDPNKCSDLIVLGLPWKSTEEDLKTYFSQFGDLVLAQVTNWNAVVAICRAANCRPANPYAFLRKITFFNPIFHPYGLNFDLTLKGKILHQNRLITSKVMRENV